MTIASGPKRWLCENDDGSTLVAFFENGRLSITIDNDYTGSEPIPSKSATLSMDMEPARMFRDWLDAWLTYLSSNGFSDPVH
jgi:hypothetical protein